MLRFFLFEGSLWSACLFALWRGGSTERGVALIILAGVEATVLAAHPQAHRFHSMEVGILMVDSCVLVALLVVAIRSKRAWLLWLTAIQGIELASHLSIELAPDVLPIVYYNVISLWIYPMLLLLALGTWSRRLARSRR